MTPAQLGIVAAIGFTGSFFGVVSGGGGLLIIPGLIMSGMTGPAAVASSRVGVLSVSLAGGYRYRRAGLIDATGGLPLMALVTAGSVAGAVLLLQVDARAFERAFGLITMALAPLVLFGRRLKLEQPDRSPTRARRTCGYVLAFAVGVYAGLFGAAWATFFTYLMVSAFGVSFLQGAAMRTFVGLAVGAITSVIVGVGGQIDPAPAAVLFCATLLGSYLGASYSLRRGEGYARQLVAVFAVLAGLKLLI
jgi:uncharacterized protein